jgi:DNA-binding response OmpR family regulator
MPEPTILICDDEPHLRELMRVSLDAGYTFAEAADSAQAIELAERLHPDLVLLDVMMPGQNGLTVIEELRGRPDLRETRILVVSAFATESDRVAAREAGADGFLPKPFDPEELERLVRELLGSRS